MVDATYIKVRENHRIVSKALPVAIGLTDGGLKEIIGISLADAETKESWTSFIRSLAARGRRNDGDGVSHLNMKKYLELNFEGPFSDELVQLTEGFSGADLESTIRDLAYRKIANPEFTFSSEVIKKSFNNVVPLSQTSPEQIEAIQNWGRERAVPASGNPIGSQKLPKTEIPRVREVLLS